jgi:hypothetical protein
MGRPKLDDGLLVQALELISSGMSIRKACAAVGIGSRTFTDKILLPEFSLQYARAMEKRADAIFDELIEISDNIGEGSDVQRDRLRVDTRKWVVSKMLPKKYGDKITQELTGADGSKLIPDKIEINFV